MSGSVKITDVHAEFGLQMDKGSVNRFKRQFNGIVKQLKEGTKEIGFSAVSSLEGVAKQGGLLGNVVGGGIRGLMSGGLMKAVVDAAVAGIKTIGVAAKQFSDEFEEVTSNLADMSNIAELLGITIQDQMRLKYFAKLNVADYRAFLEVMTLTNEMCAELKKNGVKKDDEKSQMFYWLLNGDGSNLSSIGKLDLILQGLINIKEQKGVDEAIRVTTMLFPVAAKASAVLTALISGNKGLIKAMLEAEVVPESRNKEIAQKIQDGRETVAKKENKEEYFKYMRHFNDYDTSKNFYLQWFEAEEKIKGAENAGKCVVAKTLEGFNFVWNSWGVLIAFAKGLGEVINGTKQNFEDLNKEVKNFSLRELLEKQRNNYTKNTNTFNNNTTTQPLKDRLK